MSQASFNWIRQSISDGNIHTNTVNIFDTPSYMYIHLNLPGVKKDRIDIEVFNNVIIVNAEREHPFPLSSFREIRKEYEYGDISKIIDIPICISSKDSVTLTLDMGVLVIKVDKNMENRNRFTMRLETEDELDSDDEEEDDSVS